MSIHPSLVIKGILVRQRNVLARSERVSKLLGEERWKEGDSVYGLPKVKVVRIKKKKAAKEEADAAVVLGVEGAAVPGAAPAPEGKIPAGAKAPAAAAGAKAPATKVAPAKGAAPARK
ncbi:MAG: small basic protein [Planctomycetota bacterium]